MGCREGQIFVFDPWLMDTGRIIRYNSDSDSVTRKKRKVMHVRWFEPLNEGENCNKFLVVFDDGTIYVFFRDSRHTSATKSQKLKVGEPGAPDVKEYTRDQVIALMQQEVGNFNFDKYYPKASADQRFYRQDMDVRAIFEEDKSLNDQVNIVAKAYTHRALNFILANYKYLPDDVNPNLILRFDEREINDIATFRMSDSKREHWIVAACGDGYLRVFNAAQRQMIKAVKGVSGNPLCIDLARMEGAGLHSASKSMARDLMAVGFEDDSFIIYSIQADFKPLFRGLGHRSFVSQVRFDNYYVQE